jgi:DNA-binding NarL/FixJ family response regulator
MGRCRVLIADDNARARLGLHVLLALRPEIEVVGEAADGLETVDMMRDQQADVVLMDTRMPTLDGLEATRQIKGQWPGVKIVALSMDVAHRAEALAAGADRFVLKGSPAGELLAAILDCVIADR